MEDEELAGDDEGGAGGGCDVIESLKLEAATGGELAERSKKTQKREKKNKNKKPKKYSGWITYTGRNRPKFWSRWNMGVPRTGLHASTRFSVRSG